MICTSTSVSSRQPTRCFSHLGWGFQLRRLKIHQHIDFPTREKNTLDFVYTTQRGAYKALPLPHLGTSDHITVMPMPGYRPLVKVNKPVHKQIQVWPEGSSEALQDCFDTTDWDMFKQAATQSRSSLYAEYAGCIGPPKHQGAPLLSKMF